MSSYLTLVHALSPLQAGTGQGSGVIDLPIAREKATNLPYLPGSSLKGTLRTHCPEDKRARIFGSETSLNGNGSAGTVQISDQRLLLLPVRSLAGTFAWTTSPYVLRRLRRDLRDLEDIGETIPEVPENPSEIRVAGVGEQGDACQIIAVPAKNAIYLEELDLTAHYDSRITQWADWLGRLLFPDEKGDMGWRLALRGRFCLVHDDLLSFLLRTATEITARIHLEEGSKTVMQGGLWYEEALPTETVLSGLALTISRPGGLSESVLKSELDSIMAHPLQLGGKSTVGHGLCRVKMSNMQRGADHANA